MKRILLIVVGSIALTSAQATSFDCAKAASGVEKLICGSAKLSELDDALDKAYKETRTNSSQDEAKRLVSDQRQWLKESRNTCGDTNCLEQAYLSRIKSIKQATGNAALPLTKITSLNFPAPVGHGYPEGIRQIDGDLVYSHYDNTGNGKDIVNFDFTNGRWFNWVEGKRDPELVAQDSRYIVFHTPHSASYPIEVVNRKTGATLSKLKLKTHVREAFIEGDHLVLFQASQEPPYGWRQAIAILELPSLKLIQETSIPGGKLISLQGNRIYTAYSANGANDLIIHDRQLRELGRFKLPPPIEKINSYCAPQIVQNEEDDRALLIANCGEMHVLNLKSFSIERSIPRYSLFYSVALYKGLLFTTTEKQNGIIVFDMNSATEVARFPIPASYLFIKGDVLLAAEAPVNRSKDSSWPMQAYKINADLIRSGEWKNRSIIEACSRAGQAIQKGTDIYEAVKLCESSGIKAVINSGNIPANILPHAVNYATWLSQTLHRYDESLALFDRLHKYGATLGVGAVEEATLKKNVFGSVVGLKDLKTDSNSQFSKALRIGKSQKPVDAIQLPKLENDLKFLGEYAYVNSWDCYPVAGQGVGIEVFDRNTLKHLNRLSIRECDEEQQDTVGSIADDKGKLHVLTGFRYPDEKRSNYFVFDKKSWKLIKTGIYAESNNDIKFPSEDEIQEEELSTKSYQLRREYQTSTAVGGAKYIFAKKGTGSAPDGIVASFLMQGTTTSTPVIFPNRDDVIFIGNPDNLGRSSIIYFDPATSRSATLAILPAITAWAADDSYFYISNGVDIMVFDLSDLSLKCLIPRIFWTSSDGLRPVEPAGGESEKMKITKIYLDRNKMIVRTLYGVSLVFDTKKLEDDIRAH
jgi:uncharacterized protein